MKLFPAIVAAALLLQGCGQPWEWASTGNASVDFSKASYECERDMRMSAASFGDGIMRQYYADQFVIRCMSYKGWYRKPIAK